MKKIGWVLFLLVLMAAPAAFACDTCTWGTMTKQAMCKSGVTTGMGACWVLPDYSDCDGTYGCNDTTGNPGAGGPVGPTGGGDCQGGFFCPPSCPSCSGVKY